MRGDLKLSLQDMVGRAVEIHGHKGPFLMIGLKASIEAAKRLGSVDFCVVSCPPVKPYLCVLDGVKAFLPNVKLEVEESEGLTLTFKSGAKAVSFKVKDEVLARYLGRPWSILPALADEVFSKKFCEIFRETSRSYMG